MREGNVTAASSMQIADVIFGKAESARATCRIPIAFKLYNLAMVICRKANAEAGELAAQITFALGELYRIKRSLDGRWLFFDSLFYVLKVSNDCLQRLKFITCVPSRCTAKSLELIPSS